MPVTLLIDTGTDVNYLSATITAKAGLPIKTAPETVKSRAPDGKPWQYVAVPSIITDQLNLRGQTFFLLPANQLPKYAVSVKDEKSNDGILGAQTLTIGAMMLDWDRDWMTLWYPGDLSQSDRDAEGFQTVYTVPITPMPDKSGRWVAQATLTNGGTTAATALMIDTGAQITTIPTATANQLKLKSDGSGTATLFLNKGADTDYATVERIQVGDFVVLNHKVYYASNKNTAFPVSLGMDIFRGYAVLMDFAQKKMYLGYLKVAAKQPGSEKPSK